MMIKKDKMNALFENLQNGFDIETPNEGHEDRFLVKLKANKTAIEKKPLKRKFYKSFMAIAAILIIGLGLFTFIEQEPKTVDLASVSPELSKTQDFFTTAISSELNKLHNQRTPETELLIKDALKQMQQLEKQYETLKINLKESGQDQRVIFAMINNFQNRIDVLQNVLTTIEDLKTFKNSKNNQIIL